MIADIIWSLSFMFLVVVLVISLVPKKWYGDEKPLPLPPDWLWWTAIWVGLIAALD